MQKYSYILVRLRDRTLYFSKRLISKLGGRPRAQRRITLGDGIHISSIPLVTKLSGIGLVMRVVFCRTASPHAHVFSPSPFLRNGVNPTSCLCTSASIHHTKCCSCLPFRRQNVVAGARRACSAVMHTASAPSLRHAHDTRAVHSGPRLENCSSFCFIMFYRVHRACAAYIVSNP